MARWRWLLLQFTRKLWVRATLIGALGILAAMAATLAERYMPWDLPGSISAEAVDSILSIIASSMLAVTTFSLSIMTSAFGAATNTVTPRATVLLIQDGITQNVLSTFIGSFLFSMVALVVLKTGAYGPRGRLVLFVVTVGIIVLIVIALLRWINHLMLLGRVGETTDRVERATRAAIEARLDEPFLGGRELRGAGRAAPQGAEAVRAGTTGYVQFIDMAALQDEGERAGRPLHVPAIPGTFVYPDTVLAWLGAPDAATGTETRTEAQSDPEADAAARAERIRQAFSVGTRRSYDQDPRFGIVVLSEIAIRALSPAVNDSGTAIDVIGRCARLLALWAEGARGDSGQSHQRRPAKRAHLRATRVRIRLAVAAKRIAGMFARGIDVERVDIAFGETCLAQLAGSLARFIKGVKARGDNQGHRNLLVNRPAGGHAHRAATGVPARSPDGRSNGAQCCEPGSRAPG
ncbi:hypothetical protein LMG26696_01113 [Achromobacter pulmonis]|uniref:DUF2254 domain-containing protein n=1 Tax=Achromobacter pulmonis TaxID=1389932 RepID=UPI00146876A5|nr:hypothetical protein LMG26696_01113 [Achromobacter pulmonis]